MSHEYLMVWLIGIGGVGALLIWLSKVLKAFLYESLKELLRDGGIALIVAAVLGATVDLYLKSRAETEHDEVLNEMRAQHAKNLQEIQRDVFTYVYGAGSSKPVVDEVKQSIFGSKFNYEELRIICQLKPIPNDVGTSVQRDRFIVLEVRVHYRLRNRTDEQQTYETTPYCTPQLSLHGFDDGYTQYSISGAIDLKENDLSSAVTRDGVRQRLKVPPVNFLPHEVRDVTYAYSLIKGRTDNHMWFIPFTAETIGIQAFVDGSLNTLKFDYETTQRESKVKMMPPTGNLHEWMFQGIFLPYQSITLYWTEPTTADSSPGSDRGDPNL